MVKEAEITEWFGAARRLDRALFPIGIGDDMAEVNVGGGQSVLITTDMLLEGTHFLLGETGLEAVGYKAMAVNLSDCAAMATRPLCAVCAVGLPRHFGAMELKELHAGIVRAADAFECPLVGGDMTSWEGKFAINITMLSRPAEGISPVRRDGAKAGDAICVTGTLGGSLARRHLEFVPRVKEAIKLAGTVHLNAMMDLSDGLSTDLNHLCRLSKVGAVVDAASVPVSEAAKQSNDPISAALNDGEDFELLFTLSEENYRRLKSEWKETPGISKVGVVTAEREVLISRDGTIAALAAGGYDHLR
jgi:thiamine-monophosphate kinase